MSVVNRQFPGVFLIAAMGLLTVSSVVVSEQPATFDVREFVCPLGGEHFTQDVGYFSLGTVQFVDGSWLGDTRIDVRLRSAREMACC